MVNNWLSTVFFFLFLDGGAVLVFVQMQLSAPPDLHCHSSQQHLFSFLLKQVGGKKRSKCPNCDHHL